MIFGVDEHRPVAAARAAVHDLAHDRAGVVLDQRMRRVEAEAVEVILANPVARVVGDEAPHDVGAAVVEVERAPPRRRMPIGEIRRVELRQVCALRTEVVVDDVEHDRDAERVRAIDEAAQIVRTAVRARRRIEAHAVVTPVALARKIRHRHQLDRRDAEVPQRRQPRRRARRTCLQGRTFRRAAGTRPDHWRCARPSRPSVHSKAAGSMICDGP